MDGSRSPGTGMDSQGSPTIIITRDLDLAVLQGILRHLFNLGLPLIYAIGIEEEEVKLLQSIICGAVI